MPVPEDSADPMAQPWHAVSGGGMEDVETTPASNLPTPVGPLDSSTAAALEQELDTAGAVYGISAEAGSGSPTKQKADGAAEDSTQAKVPRTSPPPAAALAPRAVNAKQARDEQAAMQTEHTRRARSDSLYPGKYLKELICIRVVHSQDISRKQVGRELLAALKGMLSNVPGVEREIEVTVKMSISTSEDKTTPEEWLHLYDLTDLDTTTLEVTGIDPGDWIVNAAVVFQSQLN